MANILALIILINIKNLKQVLDLLLLILFCFPFVLTIFNMLELSFFSVILHKLILLDRLCGVWKSITYDRKDTKDIESSKVEGPPSHISAKFLIAPPFSLDS